MRYCENDCGTSLEGRRKDARYCSDLCRYEAWAKEHPQRLTTDTGESETPSKRRTPRRENGIRVYLLPDELDALIGLNRSASLAARSKLAVARIRLHERNKA